MKGVELSCSFTCIHGHCNRGSCQGPLTLTSRHNARFTSHYPGSLHSEMSLHPLERVSISRVPTRGHLVLVVESIGGAAGPLTLADVCPVLHFLPGYFQAPGCIHSAAFVPVGPPESMHPHDVCPTIHLLGCRSYQCHLLAPGLPTAPLGLLWDLPISLQIMHPCKHTFRVAVHSPHLRVLPEGGHSPVSSKGCMGPIIYSMWTPCLAGCSALLSALVLLVSLHAWGVQDPMSHWTGSSR